jgi:hypothetical protein
VRRGLWALAFLLPLAVGAGLIGWKSGEDAILDRASAQLRRGELERALGTLRPLPGRRFLSRAGRRRGAELFFRLGEDGVAHTLLQGQGFDPEDPEDQRLRDLGGRCLRAGHALRRADRTRSPQERLALLRPALKDLPEAPRLLQRVVIEELGAVISARSEAEARRRTDEYLAGYQELREKAPGLADEVKRRHEELLGAPKPSGTRTL